LQHPDAAVHLYGLPLLVQLQRNTPQEALSIMCACKQHLDAHLKGLPLRVCTSSCL
jgi:hypothetical protein